MDGVQAQIVAKTLDIHPFMLSRWRKEYREGKIVSDKRKKVVSLKQEKIELDKILFSLDERSLRAAFLLEDFQRAAQGQAHVFSTFMMPLLIVLKTADRPLLAVSRKCAKPCPANTGAISTTYDGSST